MADIKKKVSAAKSRLKAEFSRARAALAREEKALGKYVQKNPRKSVAVAAGIGAVIAGGIAAAVIKHKRKHR